MAVPDLRDETIIFGDMRLWHGTAFLRNDSQDARVMNRGDSDTIPVAKSWIEADSRSTLVEAVEYTQCVSLFDELDMGVGVSNGFVVDWILVSNGGSMIFQTGQTYWIRPSASNPNFVGGFGLGGSVTFQPGAVLKFNKNSYLYFYGNVTTTTGSSPVIFTASDDNSVGEAVSGGELVGGYAAPAFHSYFNNNDINISRFDFRYCQQAAKYSANPGQGTKYKLIDCRFQDTSVAIVNGGNCSVQALNPMMCNVGTQISGAVTLSNPTVGCIPLLASDIDVVGFDILPGQTLTGFPTILFDALGPRPIVGASLFVDGNEVDSDATGLAVDYFYLGVDTTLFSNGPHKLSAVAHDDAESGTTGADDPVGPTADVQYGGGTISVQFNNFLSNAKIVPDSFPDSSVANAAITGTFTSPRNWQIDIALASDPSVIYRTFSGAGSSISIAWDRKDGNGQAVPATLLIATYKDKGPVGGPSINPPADLVVRTIKNKVLGRFAGLGQGHHGLAGSANWSMPAGVDRFQPLALPPWGSLKSVRTIAKDLNSTMPKFGIYPPVGFNNSFQYDDTVTAGMFKPTSLGGTDYLNKADLGLYVGHSAVSFNKLPLYNSYMPFIPVFRYYQNSRDWVGMHQMSLGSSTLKWAAFYSCNWLREYFTIVDRDPTIPPLAVLPQLLNNANGLCMNNQLHILHGFATEMTLTSDFGKQWLKALTHQTGVAQNHTMLGAWKWVCRRTQSSESGIGASTRNRSASLFWPECQGDYFIGWGPNSQPVLHPSGFLELVEEYEWADAAEPF